MTGNTQVIDVGGIEVRALFLGRAHTGGDLMVHLPKQKILFMSEAYLNRVFPAMRSAYPTEWVSVIDKALAMDVDRYVPGHGFIEEPKASREELVEFRNSLQAVIAEVTRLHKQGSPRTMRSSRPTGAPTRTGSCATSRPQSRCGRSTKNSTGS